MKKTQLIELMLHGGIGACIGLTIGIALHSVSLSHIAFALVMLPLIAVAVR